MDDRDQYQKHGVYRIGMRVMKAIDGRKSKALLQSLVVTVEAEENILVTENAGREK